MDSRSKLTLASYCSLREDAAKKLRDADRLGVHLVANLIRTALPAAATLLLFESDQSIDFEWSLAHLLDADGEVIADIDSTGIALTDGTLLPFEDGETVWAVITELPERIPTVGDLPAAEYTSWFHPDGTTARIDLTAAASDDV
ncbi:hypothetical protein ACWGJ9_10910 [Curtobacterium citreum]